MEVYSFRKSIEKFFDQQVSLTRQQCDELAPSLSQGPVSPVPIQRSYSYTVSSEGSSKQQKVIQFRSAKVPLNMELLATAKDTYGDFVPSTEYHGDIGNGLTAPAKVYIMEKAPGITYLESNLCDQSGNPRSPVDRKKVIQGFARFIASGRLRHQQVSQRELEERKADALEKLSILASGLPSEFRALIDRLQEASIRIVDWKEASIRPFGMDLVGLEILGYMSPEGWKYYDGHAELETEFWKVFWDAVDINKVGLQGVFQTRIQAARELGILFQFGFRGKTMQVVAGDDPNLNSLKYLRALLLA